MYNTIGMPEFYQEAKRKNYRLLMYEKKWNTNWGMSSGHQLTFKYFNRKLSAIR